MVSATRLRLNHYETLELSPRASAEEIRSAFTRVMGMFGAHPAAAAASVSAAFEVLRDPARRRAYDRELALLSKPNSDHWRVAGVGWSRPGLTNTAWASSAQPTTAKEGTERRDPPSAMHVPPAEPRLASFISSSLRDLARPIAPEAAGVAELQKEPQDQPKTTSAATRPESAVAQLIEPEMWLDADARPLDLWRPALIGLGAIFAAVLIGAIAGVAAGDQDQQPQPVKRGVTVALPATAPQPSAAPAHVPAVRMSERQVQRLPAAKAVAAPVRDERAERRQVAAADAQPINAAESAIAANAPPAVDAAVSGAGAGVPKAVATTLPLPNRTIARTIARIGYSCGTVLSTTSVEGAAPGVYKVVCSSGETFQATPVRGRYRFRRYG